MSTPEERLKAVKKNYVNAQRNFNYDMDAAGDDMALREAIQRNLDLAELEFQQAIESGLTANNDAIEQQLLNLNNTIEETEELRKESQNVAKIVKAMAKATDFAQKLVKIAT